MNLKFETHSARVKGTSFHPTKPWIISSLHSGIIQIWDFNMKILIAKFDEVGCPIRGVDFHPNLPLFVTGSDDGDVRVWNYKQKRCTFTLKGHIDYLRTVYFHHELPWILSASDDQTMRIWNYQNRNCVNIITGHCHYVMCAQFHPEKNLIVSASLDSTIRIWDFQILRKKLTQTKNPSAFIGIQIECIKILEGHEKGANWVAFHPSQNLIASGSDDRKIKLWKYTNEVAWQHSTILGHKANVSCVMFDKLTGNLISNSEDKTVKVWNIETKTEIITEKKEKARFWILAASSNGSLLASGHDEGLDIYQLNKETIPYAILDSNLLIYAQGMNTYIHDITTKKQKMELYQYVPKEKNSVYMIDKINPNPFEPKVFMVQINVNGQFAYLIKKKQQHLVYPTISQDYEALNSCFISATHVAMLTSPREIKFMSYLNKNEKIKTIPLKDPFYIKSIFSSNKPNELFIVTQHNNKINKLDVTKSSFVARQTLEDINVQALQFGFDKIAIMSKHQIVITAMNLRRIVTIRETYPIESVFWEREDIIFYTTVNHLKYGLLNGETGVIKTLEQPLRLIKKIQGSKFLVFNEKEKLSEINFPEYEEIQFKLAINRKQWDKVKHIIKKVACPQKKILIKYLMDKGHSEIGLDMVTDTDEKFALAIYSSNFQLAFDLCNKKNTAEAWKMLGEQALKQGIFEAYELACQKLKNFDELNFLYSLQSNTEKLQKMLKIAKKMNNNVLAYNTGIFLNNSETYENVLREAGLQGIAELSVEAKKPQDEQCDLLKRLGSAPLTLCQPIGDDNFCNWPHNIEDDEDEQEEDEEDD